jgi:hypothetical protein
MALTRFKNTRWTELEIVELTRAAAATGTTVHQLIREITLNRVAEINDRSAA